MPDDDDLWTPKDVAKYLKVSEETLSWWRRRGGGPPWGRVGRHPRYDEAAVRQWFKDQMAQQAASA